MSISITEYKIRVASLVDELLRSNPSYDDISKAIVENNIVYIYLSRARKQLSPPMKRGVRAKKDVGNTAVSEGNAKRTDNG